MNAKALKTVGRWAPRLIMLGLVLLIAGAITVLTVIPRATHGAALTVLTGSMTPTIPVGSVVLDRPVDPGTLHVGDIATYQKTPGVAEYITHRIVAINTKTSPVTFTFKGDANRGADLDAVPATAIRGKVWFHVPYLGGIRDALQAKGAIALCAFALLIGYAIVQAVGLIRDRRKRTNASDVQPDPTAPEGALDSPSDDAPSANPAPAYSGEAAADRHLRLATFRSGLAGRLSRESVVWLLNGTVVEEDESSFTVIIIEAPEVARRTSALLETLEPTRVESLIAVSASISLSAPRAGESSDNPTLAERSGNELVSTPAPVNA
jgi:signal peptidase I